MKTIFTSVAAAPAGRLCWLATVTLPACLVLGWPALRGAVGGGPAGLTLAGAVLAFLLAASSWTDATRGLVFNGLTYPSLLWALAANALPPDGVPTWAGPPVPLGSVGLSQSLLGAAVGFGVMLFLYRLSGGGAGDVKLAAAIGGLVGFRGIVETLMYAYVAAGVFAVARGVWAHGPVRVTAGFARWAAAGLAPGLMEPPDEGQRAWLSSKVRLAPFFAAGVVSSALAGGLPW